MLNRIVNRYFWQTCLCLLALNGATALQAAPGAIADSPLFTNSNVPPNIFFEVDDSGSMDWEVLTKKYWHYCAYDRDANGTNGDGSCGWLITNGLFRIYTGSSFQYFEYIYDNGDDAYGNGCNSSRQTLDLCSQTVQDSDWRIRSKDVNVLYYDPAISYTPWQGTGMTDASFFAARSDPQPTASGYNEKKNLNGFVYEVWRDTHSFNAIDGRPFRGSNINRVALGDTNFVPGFVDLWDDHVRYTVNNDKITIETISYTINSSGSLIVKTPIPTVTLTDANNDTLNGKTLAEVRTSIANWYQYYRRRAFVTKAALGKVVSENPGFRYGLNFINNTSFPVPTGNTSFIEVPTGIAGFTSHNTDLLTSLYSLNWPARGTPLRLGLERAGQYFDHNGLNKTNDPIPYACQQNFSVLFTDGYSNGGDPGTVTTNVDGDPNKGVTVADVARYYYTKDLSALANTVPQNIFDPATYQHMVTFTVAFGVTGALLDNDNDGWPDNGSPNFTNLSENSNWGDASISNSPEKIDDLWHAAYNSKGTFVSAATPLEVSNALTSAIGNVGSRVGSAAAVAFNTTSLSGDSAVYLAQFNKAGNKWSGDLLAFPLDPVNGDVNPTPAWQAASVLDALAAPASSRIILTYDNNLVLGTNTGNGIPFRWSNLTASQKDDLRTDANGATGSGAAADLKAQARLNFLRGDRSNELNNGGVYKFRNRNSILGDIIHSDPVFVKKPLQSWPAVAPFPTITGARYTDFSAAQANRAGTVYVGANDGKLHGFAETDGTERLAYIPNHVFSSASATEGLHFLTDIDYVHRYYVDLPPTVSDVYIDKGDGIDADGIDGNKDWHTILIGGNRNGGRGIFALDITDPTQFTEANAANIALWEFTSANDPDLGLTFSKPVIAMMNNGRWAAIFGNGYNNTGDGTAKLFILFLDGGVDGTWTDGSNGTPLDYLELPTQAGSIVNSNCLDPGSNCNGLSSPEAVDLNGDYSVDRVYAGDIKGNLWVFDVSQTTAGSWFSAYATAGIPTPLFIAGATQPIMDKPVTVKHPTVTDQTTPSNAPNVLVFFGTGQYLIDSDVSTTPSTQSFYGVWDHGSSALTPSNLVEQTFDTTSTFVDAAGNDVTSQVRVLSNNPVDYATQDGWKINFNLASAPGERVVVDPDIRAGLVFFSTWIPDNSPCNSGGTGFLMGLKQDNGGLPDAAAFDFNGDDSVDANDLVKDANNVNYAPAGEFFTLGLPASSSFLSDYQYTPGTDSNSRIDKRRIIGSTPPPGPPGGNPTLPTGRISWQELR